MAVFSHYPGLDDISNRLALPALVFSIVTPLIVLFRFVARCTHGNHLGADDWTILAALCFAETVSVMMIVCCEWGFGKHTKELPHPLVTQTLQAYFYAQIFYKITFGLTKISILLLYLRVFGVWKNFKILCWVMLALVLSFTTSSVIASIFQCSPVSFAYDKHADGGHGTCINLTTFWYANAGFNIGTDAIIILMPIIPVTRLQIPFRSKIALMSVFGVGIIVNVTSILRFTTLNLSTSHKDIMYQSIGSSMWTVIEYNLAIIAASMPALRRPLAQFFPKILSLASDNSARGLREDEKDIYTQSPSTGRTSTTKTWSTYNDDTEDPAYPYKEKAFVPVQEDISGESDRHISGLRTTWDVESGVTNVDSDAERNSSIPPIPGDMVAKQDWLQNGIWKTTEVSVEPESKRSSINQFSEHFPKPPTAAVKKPSIRPD